MKKRFHSGNKCWIYEKLFSDKDKKVKEHDHITGKYRGSAHSDCSINIELTKKASVIFHNLRGYESHLIMQEIGKFDIKVNVIPNVLEKYMAFIINKNLVFIESMQFANSSLDALVKNLTDNDFEYLSQEFNSEQLNLVKQKEVCPYEYINSFEKFSEDKLSNRCEFSNSLKDGCISQKDYLHAVNVWNEFKIKSLGNYHDFYFKTDVLLLTDVLEKFINWLLESYRLDPCHYFSSHSWIKLGWNTQIDWNRIRNYFSH